MDSSNLIIDFVEGGIDQGAEDKLFSSLASDRSLRRELQQQIEIERVALSDVDAFTPHPNTTNAIFERLNIDGAGVVLLPTFGSRLAELWFRFRGNFASALVAASFTAILFYFLQPYSGMNENSTQDYAGNSNNTQHSILAAEGNNNNAIPVVSSGTESENNSLNANASNSDHSHQGNNKSNNAIIEVTNSNSSDNNLAADQSLINDSKNSIQPPIAIEDQEGRSTAQTKSVEPLLALTNSTISPMAPAAANNAFLESNPGSPQEMELSSGVNLLNTNKLSIEFKGSEYYSFPKAPVSRSTTPFLENSGLTLFYHASDDLMIGFDLRQEFFSFEYKDADNIYKQHTNFAAYGLSSRWNFYEYYGFRAHTGLYLGANQTGVIGRAMLGFEYSPSQSYGFVFGLEGSDLMYQHNNTLFNSSKLGFYYGIRFKL
jgi:hypothetical protein